MISIYKNFKGNLTKGQIDDAAEKYGYEDFIPYGLVEDLFAVWTYIIYDK